MPESDAENATARDTDLLCIKTHVVGMECAMIRPSVLVTSKMAARARTMYLAIYSCEVPRHVRGNTFKNWAKHFVYIHSCLYEFALQANDGVNGCQQCREGSPILLCTSRLLFSRNLLLSRLLSGRLSMASANAV